MTPPCTHPGQNVCLGLWIILNIGLNSSPDSSTICVCVSNQIWSSGRIINFYQLGISFPPTEQSGSVTVELRDLKTKLEWKGSNLYSLFHFSSALVMTRRLDSVHSAGSVWGSCVVPTLAPPVQWSSWFIVTQRCWENWKKYYSCHNCWVAAGAGYTDGCYLTSSQQSHEILWPAP